MPPRDEPALRQGTLKEGSPEYAFGAALCTLFNAGTVSLCSEGCARGGRTSSRRCSTRTRAASQKFSTDSSRLSKSRRCDGPWTDRADGARSRSVSDGPETEPRRLARVHDSTVTVGHGSHYVTSVQRSRRVHFPGRLSPRTPPRSKRIHLPEGINRPFPTRAG